MACLGLGAGLCALSAQTILQTSLTATVFVSGATWPRIVELFGGTLAPLPNGEFVANPSLGRLFAAVLLWCAASWLAGGWWIARKSGKAFADALASWGTWGGLWWIVGGSWEMLRIAVFSLGWTGGEALLLGAPHFWFAGAIGAWLATFFTLAAPRAESSAVTDSAPLQTSPGGETIGYRVPAAVLLFIALYVVVFTAMNWQLYRGLLLPHGDSAMYEEHLWNLTHGKGFRSYLDQGLFLGEHIQVVHVLLLPLYLVWRSHLLLELCQSAILAAGAIPIYWLARRHTGSTLAGTCLAAAYLLYFPMQFLDIAIDLKTFRPNAFGVTTLLLALDQLERRNYRSMLVWVAVTLSAQEDWAIILTFLGVWIALCHPRGERPGRRSSWLLGGGLALFNVAYLYLATRVVILWFRDGKEIHYAGYFTKWGHGLTEIAWNMLTHPVQLVQELATAQSAFYALALLLPVGFLPLFSPGRLAVALPVFVTLCLNEVARDPRHHFHSPVVPIVFWAAAAGLGNVAGWCRARSQRKGEQPRLAVMPAAQCLRFASQLTWTSSLAIGLFLSLSPAGITFWDPGSEMSWRRLYVPGKRAELFPRVLEQIPVTARVASTDFVHPRFTHYERSYDYSDYPRAVSNYEPKVPDDTDYIVIDTQHPYSKIKSVDQVREIREHPDRWEELPIDTEGYFIVLKRRG